MSQNQIDELLDEYWEADSDPVKVSLLEEAIRMSDALGDIAQSYTLRSDLIDIATFCGFQEKALVAFVWLLSEFDKHPDECDGYDVLWKYKWILGGVTDFPKVSKKQIVSMQDDYQRRLTEMNYGLGPVHYLRWTNFMRMGDFERVDEFYENWKKAGEEDELGDCDACVADTEVELMLHLQKNKEALQKAKPILSGKMSCAEVPQLTYGRVMRALLRLDQLDKAEEIFKKGHRPLSKNPDFLSELSELQLYLVRQRRFVKAVNTLEKGLPWATTTANLDARYKFYWATALLLRALAADGKSTRKLKLPPQLPCYREASDYDLGELSDWFETETRKLVDIFNQRNGNDYCTRLIEESRELARV